MKNLNRKELIKKLIERDEIKYVLAQRRLSHYIKAAWDVLEPDTKLEWGWHLDYLCEHLEAVKLGQIRRLIINIPPRNLKSIMGTVCFPTWVWIDNPYHRFLFTSYSQTLSTKHSVDRRELIQSKWYQAAWADKYSISVDQNEKMKFSNDKRGHMIATSMGGSATGEGGDTLIIDDPHDTTIAESKTKREKTLIDIDRKFTTRLNDKKKGNIILIMQRLHPQDATGHLLAKEAGYIHVKLPAIAEEREERIYPISKKCVKREPGDVLHPEREGLEELARIKKEMTPNAFEGQYQQRPNADDGGIIKREWVIFYRKKDLPPRFDEEVQSWDCSFKDGKTSDYVAGQVWARFQANKYLLFRVKERMDIVRTMAKIKIVSNQFPRTYAKYIEDKANGPAVIQIMKDEISGLRAVEPEGSKESRLNSIAPDWAAGNIYLPHPEEAPWVLEYIEELVGFPNTANDDEVDATSQAVIQLRGGARLNLPDNDESDSIGSITGNLREH